MANKFDDLKEAISIFEASSLTSMEYETQGFKVKLERIATINVKPKKRRVGRYAGMTNKYKKAIIKLAEGQTIDLG